MTTMTYTHLRFYRGLPGALLAITALAVAGPSFAQTVGGDTLDSNLPLGTQGSYFGEYQEIISSSAFSTATTINDISFAVANDPAFNQYSETATYNLSVSLGYTTAPVDTTDPYTNPAAATFVTPTAPAVTLFSGNLVSDLTVPTQNTFGTNTPVFNFSIPGTTPFMYNPTLGQNLLLTINITSASSINDNTGGGGEQDFFLDGSAPPPTGSGSASEIYYQYVGGPIVADNAPLLTQFSFTPHINAVPESSPVALVMAGGALLLLTAGLKARRRVMAATA